MELTTDNLEYIIFVAREYCYPNKQQLKDCDAIRDAEDMAVSIAITIFRQRHPILMEEFEEAYGTYLSNDKIQNTLNIYKLNADKFWLLFLFITDFTNSCFTYSPQNEKYTIREIVKKMSQLINKEEVKGYSLTLSCEEETISSSNPLLIALFEDFCAKLSNTNDDFLDTTYYSTLEVVEDKVKTKKMRFFVELFRYFLDAHITAVKPSKITFIGRFLYLANIAEQEWFYTSYLHTPITKRNQFMIKRYGTVTLNEIEYIKEPIDVGKKIADTIKKCTDYAPISTSNYFCAPL